MVDASQISELPSVFGRYLLVHRLSRGGMGEVFLARVGEVEGFEKPLVIKKVLPDLARDTDFISRFVKEAQIAIKLAHGNIAQVYEVGLVHGEYFLAMEYVLGRDLRALFRRAQERGYRLPADMALFLVREVANALAYAHRQTDASGRALELVHCDISPPNVLVSYEGEVKVIDFGVARSAMGLSPQDSELGFGKVGYMAPEQLIRGASVDRRTDIYALGILLYELLTNQRAFNFPPDVDFRRMAREVTSGTLPRPSERMPSLGDELDGLVMRALRANPAERYGSAEDFRDAVQQKLYAMNPTVSNDTLAAVMRELFASEQAAIKAMLDDFSRTDIAPFQEALHDATNHTVSYALGGALSVGPASEIALAIRSEDAPRPGPRPTRQLSQTERAAARASEAERLTADVLRPRRRPVVLFAVFVVAVLVATAALATFVKWSPNDGYGGQAEGLAVADLGEPPPIGTSLIADSAPVPLVARSIDAALDARVVPIHVVTTARPDAAAVGKVVSRRATRRAAIRRVRAKGRARKVVGKVARKVAAPRESLTKVTRSTVRRKFSRVRREYQRFVRSYGDRLGKEWQRIYFEYTYLGSDQQKFAQLDRRLDRLRTLMAQVKGDGS